MQNHKPGTSVVLTFSLVDEFGNALVPTGLRWRILDESEAELQAWTVIGTLPVDSDLSVTVSDAYTTLTAPALRAIRTVEIEVTTAVSVVSFSESFIIQGRTSLAFGINSFQTFGQAALLAEDFTPDQVAGWISADRDTREKAMIQAYRRLLELPIKTGGNGNMGWNQSTLTSDSVISNFSSQLRNMTPVQMANLYPQLLTALRSAQLVEANDILSYDPIAAARDSGLTAMTVGESSQFFRSVKPLDLPVSSKAIAYLQRWISISARIGRS